jgi:hypothetical protein
MQRYASNAQRYGIRYATKQDAEHIGEFLCGSDMVELSGLGITEFKEATVKSFDESSFTLCGYDFATGEPIVMWGINHKYHQKLGFNIVWMLSTERLHDFTHSAIRTAKQWIMAEYQQNGALGNILHRDNKFSVPLLLGLGFQEEQVPQLNEEYVLLVKR